jgi:hypothetical protein
LNFWGASLIFCACVYASTGAATPCVGDSFDQPIPGATDVVIRHSDIPSSQFPGLWQEGRIEGLSYRLFANGDGDIRSDNRETREWQIAFVCSGETEGCVETIDGRPPEAAASISASLQSCFLGEELVVPDIPELEPEVAQDTKLATSCDIALLPDDSDEVSVQKLLTIAGADPGPADGLIGPQTLDAFAEVTGESVETFDLSSATLTLVTLICDQESVLAQ